MAILWRCPTCGGQQRLDGPDPGEAAPAEPEPAMRVVYVEDLRPGMVIDIGTGPGKIWATLLAIRSAGGVHSFIVDRCDGRGQESRQGYGINTVTARVDP